MVPSVNRTSTKVIAKASTIGWYMAAFRWRRTITRCANKAGISDKLNSAGKKTELKKKIVKFGSQRRREIFVQEEHTSPREIRCCVSNIDECSPKNDGLQHKNTGLFKLVVSNEGSPSTNVVKKLGPYSCPSWFEFGEASHSALALVWKSCKDSEDRC